MFERIATLNFKSVGNSAIFFFFKSQIKAGYPLIRMYIGCDESGLIHTLTQVILHGAQYAIRCSARSKEH